MQYFRSAEDLIIFFAPSHWPYALAHTTECLTAPCISLAQVDELYTKGTALSIVKAQFVGIYSLSTAKEQYKEQASSLAAGMFMARYGHICSLYDMMLYFSNYLLEYKQSYSAYDVQDILLQFSRKFIPWKRSRLQVNDENIQESPGCGGLYNAIVLWMMKGDTDEDIRSGGFYRMGKITDKMIKDARAEYSRRMEGDTF